MQSLYPQTTTLLKESFDTESEYSSTYRDFCSHYDFKARVDGGWVFFTYFDDFRTWTNQQ
jgi:hypothetical protein